MCRLQLTETAHTLSKSFQKAQASACANVSPRISGRRHQERIILRSVNLFVLRPKALFIILAIIFCTLKNRRIKEFKNALYSPAHPVSISFNYSELTP